MTVQSNSFAHASITFQHTI